MRSPNTGTWGVETQFEYNTDSRRYGHSNNDASTTWFAGPSVTLKLPEYNASLGVSAQFSLYQNYDAVARIGERRLPHRRLPRRALEA